ncbi:MAG: ABC transporter substrate-binding protein [Cyanobacteria bacterium SBLK]|nr:ABC transporter substrate-binding protein [Cyanobacteria bacterium SBLK]
MPRFARFRLIPFAIALSLTFGCQSRSPDNLSSDRENAECVKNYDPDVDYFRERIQPEYATGFSVEYHKNYKLVTVRNPWRDTNATFQYLLVLCGTPQPQGYEEMQAIAIPIQTVVTLSTTNLPHLDRLGVVDRLIGVNRFSLVNTTRVREKIQAGELIETGSGRTLNLERLLERSPDLILTYGTGNPEFDRHEQLNAIGLPVAIVAEYMESSPLGRAEWLKFTSLFFNREAEANEIFSEIPREYQRLIELTREIENPPTVFAGFSYEGTWYVAGANSYAGQFLEDAGADYIWSDLTITGSSPKDFEVVFDRAKDADYWLNASQAWQSREDAISADVRYGKFAALQGDRVFNLAARLSPEGGNDYWETGMLEPHLILADLIAILHPELLSDRKLKYYRQLD